jgi:hypothetical protein
MFSGGATDVPGVAKWHREVRTDVPAVDEYSGTVVINEAEAEIVALETFRMILEETSDEGVTTETLESGLPLLVALERARQESRVVIVGIGVAGDYGYFDAGDDVYEGQRLPRYPLHP